MDSPALSAGPMTVRRDLFATRACRLSGKTCLMCNVQPPWRYVGTHQAGRRTAINRPEPLSGSRENADPPQSGDLCGPTTKAIPGVPWRTTYVARVDPGPPELTASSTGSAHKNFWRFRDR